MRSKSSATKESMSFFSAFIFKTCSIQNKKNTLNIDKHVFIPQPSFVIIGNLQEKVLVGSEAALEEASREFDTHEHPQ